MSRGSQLDIAPWPHGEVYQWLTKDCDCRAGPGEPSRPYCPPAAVLLRYHVGRLQFCHIGGPRHGRVRRGWRRRRRSQRCRPRAQVGPDRLGARPRPSTRAARRRALRHSPWASHRRRRLPTGGIDLSAALRCQVGTRCCSTAVTAPSPRFPSICPTTAEEFVHVPRRAAGTSSPPVGDGAPWRSVAS